MRNVKSVYFIKSAVKPEQYPPQHLPEIAFIGRSNVGKSSLLNTLVNKKNLARISNTPGCTQLINFFSIDEKLCFVDLPGYGYAKVPQAIKEQWQPMIEAYLKQSVNLRSVILLLDARHVPTKYDLIMRAWLISSHIPMIVVATKIDKIPKTRRPKQIAIIKQTLKLQPTEQVFPFSALTKEGFKPIWKVIWQAAVMTT
jgi:GTP-binding protein